jgi:hypothetical protein
VFNLLILGSEPFYTEAASVLRLHFDELSVYYSLRLVSSTVFAQMPWLWYFGITKYSRTGAIYVLYFNLGGYST